MNSSLRRILNSINYRVVRPLVGGDKRAWSTKTDFNKSYRRLVKSLKSSHDNDEAMKLAVGGEFEGVGIIERETLIHFGLKRDDYLIDVGCGSGRLARPLSEYLTGKYLGIDVVPELVRYARTLVRRPDWRFAVAEGLSIPEEDGKADMVCFFSVFTHLLHEESYTYLSEAKRVLKPGGKVVFSFLDFGSPSHWPVFEFNLKDIGVGAHPLNMFMGRDAVRAWAAHLGLNVEFIQEDEEPFVTLPHPVTLESGAVVSGKSAFGQTVGVLSRP
jgi:SAM-dependent methyltransferase